MTCLMRVSTEQVQSIAINSVEASLDSCPYCPHWCLVSSSCRWLFSYPVTHHTHTQHPPVASSCEQNSTCLMALTLHPLSSKLTSTKHCSIVPSIKFSRPTCHRRIAVGASQTSNATASSTAAAPVVPPTDEALQQRIASVEVDLGAAVERVTVPLTDPNSRLLQATMQFPLGLVIESESTFKLLHTCAWKQINHTVWMDCK